MGAWARLPRRGVCEQANFELLHTVFGGGTAWRCRDVPQVGGRGVSGGARVQGGQDHSRTLGVSWHALGVDDSSLVSRRVKQGSVLLAVAAVVLVV